MGKLVSGRATSETSARLKSVELLYDYTKFHIGVYITLTASYITVASIKVHDNPVLEVNPILLCPAVLAFLLAGFAGGVIISSITQSVGKGSPEFLETKIGPWRSELFRARTWTYVEHNAFWVGLIMAILSFVRESVWTRIAGALFGA
jgi:hypothetical protein